MGDQTVPSGTLQKTVGWLRSFLDKKVPGVDRSRAQIRKIARELIQKGTPAWRFFDSRSRTCPAPCWARFNLFNSTFFSANGGEGIDLQRGAADRRTKHYL